MGDKIMGLLCYDFVTHATNDQKLCAVQRFLTTSAATVYLTQLEMFELPILPRVLGTARIEHPIPQQPAQSDTEKVG